MPKSPVSCAVSIKQLTTSTKMVAAGSFICKNRPAMKPNGKKSTTLKSVWNTAFHPSFTMSKMKLSGLNWGGMP